MAALSTFKSQCSSNRLVIFLRSVQDLAAEKLTVTRWTIQFRIVGSDRVCINNLNHDEASKLCLASAALHNEFASRQSVDDMDELPSVACGAASLLSQAL